MHDPREFLTALTIVLCVAAATTVVFQRLRQPVVLGYILAGLIIGPHVPIPLVADPGIVQTLSALGVILLMFSLGLEFRLRKLIEVGPTAGLTALIQSSLMMWLGFVIGRAFGWTTSESLFLGATIAISSTTIIAKAFDEQGIRGRLREFVVGILIVEDLIAILLMATLTTVATGRGVSADALVGTTARLVAFLVGLVAVGMLIVPRAMRSIVVLRRPETTLVASMGICFASALLALEFGYSVALGAFIGGSLVAESGHDKRIEKLVEPVRDLFAAIFFVSVGMLIDPHLVARYWLPITVLTLAVVVGKIVGVSIGAFLSGNGIRTSVQSGMSLAQIGEFSFIIAGLGLSLGATREFLYPIAVAVSALTTLTTPWLIRASGPVASFVDRKLPQPIQTVASLYGSWLEQARLRRGAGRSPERRLALYLALDAFLLASVAIGASIWIERLAAGLEQALAVDASMARALVIGTAAAVSVPFVVGIVRTARRLGVVLAEKAMPEVPAGRVDFAAAPRRSLVVTFQLGVVLLVGIPLVALLQPFLPGAPVALVFILLLLVLGVGFWRSATNLQGHVRAGAQMIVEALAAHSHENEPADAQSMSLVHELLPGLGEPVAVLLGGSSRAVGKTLAEIDLRGVTGATVLAIRRGGRGVVTPSADEVLEAGDVLALAGSHDAVESAKELLGAPAGASEKRATPERRKSGRRADDPA